MNKLTTLRVAAVKYAIASPADFAAFAARIEALCMHAQAAGAKLVVLPEYLALELAFALPERADLIQSLHALQRYHDAWLTLFQSLADQLDLLIQAGSFLRAISAEHFANRAYLFRPLQRLLYQDKLHLTGFEKTLGVISPSAALSVFDLVPCTVAIAVCYDAEFPLTVRMQREQGAQVLLVPSCTDTDAGAVRVRTGCMARALENRIFVVQAVTAGIAQWSPALDTNTGEASIYAPMDHGFPASGILAQSAGEQAFAIADLDLSALHSSSAQAQVNVDTDWPAQLQFSRAEKSQ
jgi:predicted amidohydrolase